MNQSFQELTDSQWQVIHLILNDKRKRWHSLGTIVNAILWLNYTGLQWRELDKMTGDTLPWQSVGLPWALAVTAANVSDNQAGQLVVDRLKGKVPRLAVIAADHGYKISFIEHVEQTHGWRVKIAQNWTAEAARKRSWFCP